MFTGEPHPVPKGIGASVRAGSRNGAGELVVEAEAVDEETVLGRILRTAEAAASRKGRVERWVDRAGGAFVPFVALTAAATAVGWWWAGDPSRAVTAAAGVLVVACPCALGLAVPLVAALGVARGARDGVVFKGADMLERAAAVDTVVFDKT